MHSRYIEKSCNRNCIDKFQSPWIVSSREHLFARPLIRHHSGKTKDALCFKRFVWLPNCRYPVIKIYVHPLVHFIHRRSHDSFFHCAFSFAVELSLAIYKYFGERRELATEKYFRNIFCSLCYFCLPAQRREAEERWRIELHWKFFYGEIKHKNLMEILSMSAIFHFCCAPRIKKRKVNCNFPLYFPRFQIRWAQAGVITQRGINLHSLIINTSLYNFEKAESSSLTAFCAVFIAMLAWGTKA